VPSLAVAQAAGVATLNIGLFINAVVKFIIVAFALFMLIKGINSLRRQEEAAPEAPAAPPREEVLLTGIRDILKTKSYPSHRPANPQAAQLGCAAIVFRQIG
jgi:large conductance mechanosensitive channel